MKEKTSNFYFSDYFEKRASVVACHILSTDPKSAIIEFENEKFVAKILDTPTIRLYGANLLLTKVSNTVLSTSTNEYNNDQIDQLLEQTVSNPISTIRNQSFPITESIPIPSPE